MQEFRSLGIREIIGSAAARCNQVHHVRTPYAVRMITTLLILHGLIAVALLGALSHQCASLWFAGRGGSSFAARYAAVNPQRFVRAVVVCFAADLILAALIYPSYRIDVRIPFEEMSLGWAVGLFELKEHAGGIGLGLLPAYAFLWRSDATPAQRGARIGITVLLAAIVWWDFLVGHVLNNIRGLA
ncbi:MAG: hypothetical protein EBR51_09050 [Gammaproteobacteria bacterium]|jgi:hypothetical protein|nr:hypothetical protein [Gammaproteobacteria bacterium]